jgi:hypothetical protein
MIGGLGHHWGCCPDAAVWRLGQVEQHVTKNISRNIGASASYMLLENARQWHQQTLYLGSVAAVHPLLRVFCWVSG